MVRFSRSIVTSSVIVQLFGFFSAVIGALSNYGPDSTNVSGKTYDYVIVGGGLSGLVVANRLTEDPTKHVLVVEYGQIDNSSTTLIPYDANSLNVADMFTDIISAPQPQLNNQTFQVWIGAVVGGGSIVNGMEYDRGSRPDYDAWESLGNPGWGWSGLLPYFKKSTTFTPPSSALAKEFGITWNVSAYGNGPVQASIPPFIYPEVPTFWSAWRELGVPRPVEGAFGDVGAFWTATSLDPKTETRSSARTAYYDPISSRPNLHLLTGHQVTEVLFNGLTAHGVHITSRADNSTIAAYASKEVVLAAGAVHTPQILMLSGVGPETELKAAGIPVKLDLPAVGANFQDHPVSYLNWNLTKDNYFPNPSSLATNATFNASSYQEYLANRTGPYTQAHGNSGAFLPLSLITPNFTGIVQSLQVQNATTYLPETYSHHPELLAGFEAQRSILIQQFLGNNSAVHEFPFNGGGSTPAALQKPVSRGTITLNKTSILSEPIVDYNTFVNPTDSSIMLAMIRYARKFFATSAMAKLGPVETAPGVQAQTDDEILAVLKAGLLQPSFAHPSCSCAMMPKKLGGCVSSELLVYGTERLSIIDASIMPMIVGAHLQETQYAIAEKAADIIKSRA